MGWRQGVGIQQQDITRQQTRRTRRELVETQAAQPDIVAGAVADVGRVDNQPEIAGNSSRTSAALPSLLALSTITTSTDSACAHA
jgi:hypothetical protein